MSAVHGWGRVPRIVPDRQVLVHAEDALQRALASGGIWTPRGLGRSYGDASLGAALLDMTGLRFVRDYDAASGEIECEAGVDLGSLLDFLLPRGRHLPVVPGTRWVTVGGAIAADVHGKNHQHAGCFSTQVLWFDLVGADGERRRVRPGEAAFLATCGGMGLTGAIVAARLRTEPIASTWLEERVIRADGLAGLLAALDAAEQEPYVVAWLDCLAQGARLGRGLVLAARIAADGGRTAIPRTARRVPCDMPGFVLGATSVRAFNALYLGVRGRHATRRIAFGPYFFPLDSVADWNRLYGRGGFVQHQCVLPGDAAESGVRAILARCAGAGRGSMLAVLKRLGPANANLLSFPTAGLTLALDFRYDAGAPAFLADLDRIVVDHGGRIYLAKDACMDITTFRAGYPRHAEFSAWRAAQGADQRFGSAQSRRLGL